MANETLIPDGLTVILGTWDDQAGGGGGASAADIDEGVGAASGADYIFANFEQSELQVNLPSRTLTGPFVRVAVKMVARKTVGAAMSIDVWPVIDSAPLSVQTIALTTDWQLFTLNWDGSWTAAQIDATSTYVRLQQDTAGPRMELDALDFVIYEEIPPDSIYQGGSLRVVVGNMCPRQGSYVWPVFPY